MNLNVFSNKVREVYLEYILKVFFIIDLLFDNEKFRLMEFLGIILFIIFVDGFFKFVCFFFDLIEDVFCIMLGVKKFLFLRLF